MRSKFGKVTSRKPKHDEAYEILAAQLLCHVPVYTLGQHRVNFYPKVLYMAQVRKCMSLLVELRNLAVKEWGLFCMSRGVGFVLYEQFESLV